MICPKCNNEIEFGLSTCPYCGNNISFTTKVRDEEKMDKIDEKIETINILKKGWVLGGGITILVLITIFKILSNLDIFNFNSFLIIIYIIFKGMLSIGIIGLIVCLILYIVKKKTKIMKTSLLISIILIVVPLISKSVVKIDGDISLKDYSKVEYIELENEKIPSVYSVVGKRKIVISQEDKNKVTEDITMDMIVIIYSDISTSDIDRYKAALIDYGFTERIICNLNGNECQQFLIKNNIKDNSFYIVTIDGNAIMYSTAKGTFEDFLNNQLKSNLNSEGV